MSGFENFAIEVIIVTPFLGLQKKVQSYIPYNKALLILS